ncbi:CoA transferase [Brevibacterium otitidis]|uniref:CoA transferase n=1 Tax=Brevibacterium otitidis TaxID=53364 RepID=A0ABV5WXL5_9MICO|nr:CoA transferase [Brevibacterium otitidis]
MSDTSAAEAPLAGLTVVEISAFIAAPLAGMTLAQLGAEVIRIDPLGGNIDANRWPISDDGTSIYWASLNKGKRSVTLDLRGDEGRCVAVSLIAKAGTVVTNLPARGWLSYERLVADRPDLVMLRLTGSHDGSPEIDYTVNAASGFPIVTGQDERPVNNVVPAWDVIAGLYVANGILSAELVRRASGQGQEITVALSDTMLATVGNLGYIAEVQATGSTRGPLGNGLYGAYGQSFVTSDGRELMVAVISNRHWRSLGEVTGLADKLAMIGPMLDVDLTTEGGRFAARDAIDAVLRPWFAAHTADEAATALSSAGVLNGRFQTFEELVHSDPLCSLENPLFDEIDQPGVGKVLAPRNPLRFGSSPVLPAEPAPQIGEDTTDVLASTLGMSSEDISALGATGVIDS